MAASPLGGCGDSNTMSCELDPCLICGSLDRLPLYAATFTEPIEMAAAYFLANRTATAHGAIVRCRDCGFVFTSPRFSNQEYDRIYSEVPQLAELDASFETANAA